MITLKEALSLSKEELEKFKQELSDKINQNKDLGGYVEQLQGVDVKSIGEGVPIAIKDNISVKDWSLTCCSNILQGYKAPYNATVIENMLNNNLGLFGQCNMDEFAMGSSTETSFYGKTKNPHNYDCVPGGSSGGSAAVVGAGLAIAALGSDTGGSIRQPAAFCGCVGMKPTYGRVSRYGLSAFSSSLDQIGPITQNVEDAAILYDIISGHDAKDSTSANVDYTPTAPNLNKDRKLKIAVIKNYIDDCSEEIKKATLETVEKLKEAGHEIIYKDMLDTQKHISTYYIVATAEASANLSRFDGVRYGNRANSEGLKNMYEDTRSQGFGEEVKRRILLGTFVLSSGYYDAYYIKAQKVRHLIKDEYDEIFKEADVILSPVTPTTAFEFGSKSDGLEMYLSDIYTISVNLAGLPALSLPIGKDSKNMPIGMQFVAKAYDEQTLFDVSLCTEELVDYK
jgi:aspartyl-tRNA(Asn)/glutamyl-tRNA(Gln) amidotransferase subunit A